MSRFTIFDTPIADLKVVERQKMGDERGFLARVFCAEELAAAGWCQPVAQINHTSTQRTGVVRGLHFQHPPHSEMKLVSCLRGAVWDVAVDLRNGSRTYLQWHAEELSAANRRALLIPPGFAHGFQTLCDDCELLYLHSMAYTPAAEAGLHAKDLRLAIDWPMTISGLSLRDDKHPRIGPEFAGVSL
jgi:dTDP-4-dehydrorhamnose 3,5-epimerase